MSDCQVNIADCIKNKSMSVVLMDKFKCHKEVHAIPMNHGVYSRARGLEEPSDPSSDGYLVVYNRGTSDEYVSWSPKHVFDDGYSKI